MSWTKALENTIKKFCTTAKKSSKNALITLESKNSRKTQLTNLSVTGTVGASFALPAIGEAISAAGAAIAGLVSWPVVAVGVAVVVVAGGISYLVYKSNSKDDDKGDSKDKGDSGAKEQGKTQGKSRAPAQGESGSTYEQVDKDGNVVSRTKYGENGKPEYREDYDHTHFDKNTKEKLQPHKHIYEYNDKGQPVKPKVPVVPIK